jgi:AcrR family transcriptional regulator
MVGGAWRAWRAEVAFREQFVAGARERAILSVVIGLLGEAGYEAMTIDAVAARAHASKTTIYRRWAGKAELVRAAVDAHISGACPARTTPAACAKTCWP